MADLFFKVNADYQELIRMQEEAAKLKSALSDFSGTRQEFESLVEQLNKLEDRMQSCSQALSEGFTKVNTSGLKEFDQSVLDLCENMEVYFGVTIGEIDEMFSSLRDAISKVGGVELAGADDIDLLPVRQQILELNEALSSQREELVKQQEAYRELANTISENFGKSVPITLMSEPPKLEGQAVPPVVGSTDTSPLQETQTAYNEVRDAATEAAESAVQGARQVTDANEALNTSLRNRLELTQASESLKGALSNYSGLKQEADTLTEPINRLEEKMKSFSQSVSDCFKQVKDAGVGELDQSISSVCENMDVNIGNAIDGIDQMLASLSGELERFGRIEITGAEDIDLTPARQQVAGLLNDLMAQREELEKQKEAYRELAESANESLGKIKPTKSTSTSTEPTSSSDTDAIDETKDAYDGVRDAATAAADAATAGTEQVTEATETLNSALERQAELSQEAVATGAEAEIAAQVEAEKELTAATNDAQAAAKETKNAHDELREGIVEARNEIVGFKDVMNQSLGEMLEKAGGIKGVADSFKKAFNSLPTKQIEKANAILERLKGTLTGDKNEAQGAANMVAQLQGENDKLVTAKNALAKVQEVVNGLEVAYEVLQKSSLLMLAVEDVKTWAVTKAKSMLGLATEGATAAQWSFNAAVAANPIGALIEILVIAAGAVWAFCDALFGSDEEMSNLISSVDEAEQLFDDLNAEVLKRTIDNTEKTMESFNKLRKEYNELGDDMEAKKKFINDHAKAFDHLRLNVDSVDAAEKIFVSDTPNVIAALKLQAEYAALVAAKFELIKKAQRVSAGDIGDERVRFGEEVSVAELRAAGYSVEGEDSEKILLNTIESVRAVNKFRREQLKDELDASVAYLEKKQKELEEEARIMHKYGNEYLDPDNKEGGGLMPKAFNSVEEEGGVGPNEKRKQKREKAKRGGGSRSAKEDKNAEAAANRREELLKQYSEKVINATEKIEGDITKADIDFMAKGTDKQIASIRNNTQNQLKALEEEKKKLISDYRKMLQEVYLTEKGAKKNDARYTEIGNMTDEDIWKNLSSKYNEEGAVLDGEVSELATKFNDRQQQILKAGLNAEFEIIRKAQEDALKSYEKYYDKQVSVQRKYQEERIKLEQQHKEGLINDEAFSLINKRIDEQEQTELEKIELDRFKTSPLYQLAMSGDAVDSDALQQVYEEMSRKMDEAAATMQPADFKAFMDAFTNVSDKMIAQNPFGALKDAVRELEEAEDELFLAHKDVASLYSEYDLNDFGVAEEGGAMWKLQQYATDAIKEKTDAENAYNEAKANGNADEVAAAEVRLTRARQNEATAAHALSAALERVNAAETKETNALGRVQSAKKKEQKSTKEAVKLTKQWAGAIKEAADMFDSPIANAISGMMSLTSTTLDSIESIKKASDASAEGVSKTAQAVTKAVAILAIIQAAWQVINQIMSLFGGKDEEEYKNRINSLKAQVDALDYAFNNLKQDMDEAWGTEAIDAYIKAVETLNDRQKAQLELIKEQSKAHIGHHSLEHYMKKEAGITDKELAAAKKRIEELGGDTSTGWITDWIYTLTADQLKQFLTEGIGVTITGKLGGVSGTGDYSGSDWLNDLQEFANSAQTAEDIADEMAAKLNGISLDGLKDEIKSLVTTFDTSFNDINNSFDGFMREAAYNKARTKYDKDLEQFYNDLKDINNLYTEGEISEEEYRKRIAEMRERYKSLVKGAQDDYQQSLTDAGVNVRDIEQGATTGGFEALSEDTGTELNGRFAAMQAQETITAENTTKLLEYTLNIHDIADEIRDVQVNSYMELREINENTKKVVEPILDMQENIKKIKEQTESL